MCIKVLHICSVYVCLFVCLFPTAYVYLTACGLCRNTLWLYCFVCVWICTPCSCLLIWVNTACPLHVECVWVCACMCVSPCSALTPPPPPPTFCSLLQDKDLEVCAINLKVDQLEAELQDLNSQESKDEASLAKVCLLLFHLIDRCFSLWSEALFQLPSFRAAALYQYTDLWFYSFLSYR